MKKFTLILISLFIFNGCSTDSGPDEPPVIVEEPVDPVDPQIAIDAANLAFNYSVSGLPLYGNDPVIRTPEVVSTDTPVEDGNFLCTTTNYKAAPEYNEMLLLDPSSDVIFPGAIIKGGTISTGAYSPIISDREPVTMSISLANISGDGSRTFNPVLNDFRNARNELLNSIVPGATPAKISFEINSVYSRDQLKMSLGANYSGATVDVGGSLDFSTDKRENSIVVKYVQEYYSIDINPHADPSDLFKTLPDVSSFGPNMPVYVSSVKYGRMILFTATSSYSNTEMEAAFNAAFDSGVTSGNVQVSAANQNIIENSSIKAFVLGGSGSSAAQVVTGIEGVKSYILGGGDYSKDSPGAPLAYALRDVRNKDISKVVLTTQYPVRRCDKLRSTFKVTMVDMDCTAVREEGGTSELYGHIVADSFNTETGQLVRVANYWGPYNDNSYQTSTAYFINVGKELTFELKESEESYIQIGGWLTEYDSTIFDADDHLGSASLKLYLKDLREKEGIPKAVKIIWNGSGDQVTVNFTVEAID